MNRNKKSTGIKFLLGLAAGVAAGYWLNTNQGREWRSKVSEKMNTWGEELGTGLQQTISKSQDLAADAEKAIKDKVDTLSSKTKNLAEDLESSFQKGSNKAKKEIESKMS